MNGLRIRLLYKTLGVLDCPDRTLFLRFFRSFECFLRSSPLIAFATLYWSFKKNFKASSRTHSVADTLIIEKIFHKILLEFFDNFFTFLSLFQADKQPHLKLFACLHRMKTAFCKSEIFARFNRMLFSFVADNATSFQCEHKCITGSRMFG